ncbi:MAG: DUF452 family protein [Bacteroidales bacterium]|nr:DUF452 family protein [Bacteroidales bacterium]
MKQQFVSREDMPRLIMVFLGWAMDHRPYQNLRIKGYDILLIWDYRDDTFDLTDLDGYEEIIVIAWSFGVPAAARFIAANHSLPITSRVAVNGTQHPVDDELGIPHALFDATLDNLSETSLPRFFRRVAGSGSAFTSFMASAPIRDIEELREELSVIALRTPATIFWDMALIGSHDLIIPPDNQRRSWQKEAGRTVEISSPHQPDFSDVLSHVVTDKSLVATRFGRAMSSYDGNAEVQHEVARRLIDIWNPDENSTPRMIEIGCGTGYSTRLYLNRLKPGSLELWDLVISPSLPDNAVKVECDAESRMFMTPPCSVDVIFTSSTVQWFNSLPAFFRNVKRVLASGGTLVMSTFGPENFAALHAILGTTSGYPSVEEIKAMLPDGLEVTHCTSESVSLPFPDPATMLRHISLTGVNALTRQSSTAATRAILREYPRQTNGTVLLTYNPIYLVIRKL